MNDSSRFLTLSNLLSISRAVLIVPFAAVALSEIPGARLWACLIMAVAALTDRLDGLLARKLHEVTDWGKILDPLADKVGVAAVALVLLVLRAIPLWFVIALVGRDLVILSGGIFLKARKGILMQSNEAGKWTVGVVALTLAVALSGVAPPVLPFLIAGCAAMLLLSLILYGVRFAGALRRPAEA